ncbi:hypothetical protein PUND_a1946 [Pseudoalteromonas undina]|nr:hypothetical protein PUND_a1946 [Pseudoalteromonas undina]
MSVLFISTISLAANKATEIDSFIQGFHELKQFNGNVLVAKHGEVILKKAMVTQTLNGILKTHHRPSFE